MPLQCGNNPIPQCEVCAPVDICGECENGLIGTTCDTCEADEYFVFVQSNRGCIDCKYSPCSQCKGNGDCTSCISDVISYEVPTCGKCVDTSKYLYWGRCIDCSLSPCGNDGICDGTKSCKCKNNNNCCIQDRGGVYKQIDGNHVCTRCTLPGCGQCPSETKLDCVTCIDGTIPSGSIVNACVPVLEKYLSEINNEDGNVNDSANSIIGICAIIISLFLIL